MTTGKVLSQKWLGSTGDPQIRGLAFQQVRVLTASGAKGDTRGRPSVLQTIPSGGVSLLPISNGITVSSRCSALRKLCIHLSIYLCEMAASLWDCPKPGCNWKVKPGTKDFHLAWSLAIHWRFSHPDCLMTASQLEERHFVHCSKCSQVFTLRGLKAHLRKCDGGKEENESEQEEEEDESSREVRGEHSSRSAESVSQENLSFTDDIIPTLFRRAPRSCVHLWNEVSLYLS